MTQGFFIVASGSGVGKTLVTTTLAWQLAQSGKRVASAKPLITGYDPADKISDTALLLQSGGLENSAQNVDGVSPWRYRLPLAPSMAARREDRVCASLDEVVEFCREKHEAGGDFLFIESLGGVMSPINDTHTVLDWAEKLYWPVVLVAGTYVGSISHTLCAIEAMKSRHLPLCALVVSESEGSLATLQETVDGLSRLLPKEVPIVKVPRLRQKETLWQHMPLISWVCYT